jgi:hypothetical protein
MTHDEERLERYREWRRAEQRDRAARRRRVLGYAAAPALCVLAVGLAAWMGRTSSQPATTAAVIAPPPPLATPPPASEVAPLPATESSPIVELPDRPKPGLPWPEPPARTRALAAQPPAPAERDTDAADLSAFVAPLPVSPPVSAPAEAPREVARETPAEAPREVARETPAEAPREVAGAEVAPGPPPPAAAPSGGAVAVAPPTVRQRVSTWANGEVQEFRDGVKREVNEFRSGYAKVRGFFKR